MNKEKYSARTEPRAPGHSAKLEREAPSELNTSRREFLRTAARITGFTGLLAVCGFLAAKSRRENCIKLDVCDACILLQHCEQPQAQQTKQTDPPKEGRS